MALKSRSNLDLFEFESTNSENSYLKTPESSEAQIIIMEGNEDIVI